MQTKDRRNNCQLLSQLLTIAFLIATASAQSGGTFVIQKSVIAGGGGQATGGGFTLDGTIGQSIAGAKSTGGGFDLSGGFWGGGTEPLANVSISGRVFTSNGVTGLRNATVTLTEGNNVRSTTTSSFGFYSFDNVAPGFSYTIRIKSRLYRFQPQVVVPTGDLTGVDFVGLE